MICSKCGYDKNNLYGAIINGKYNQYCQQCLNIVKRQASPLSASYARDRDREKHEADLVQPWNKDGSPNRDFARLYGTKNYSKEELQQL